MQSVLNRVQLQAVIHLRLLKAFPEQKNRLQSQINIQESATDNRRKVSTIRYPTDPAETEIGDKIVVASTDFDWEEAEEFEIVSITGNTITIDAEVYHTHVAETYHGVEMYAEVGLLTRRVKIHGDMEDDCYDETVNDCERCHLN